MDREPRSDNVPGLSASGSAYEYALRHLVKHLHGAGSLEAIFHLLISDPRWLDLKSSRLGNEACAEDVELAIGAFREPLEPRELVRLAELHAVLHLVHQQAGWYSDLGLQILASVGREDEAVGNARLRSRPRERFDSLMKIVQALREKEAAVDLWLDELTRTAWQIEDAFRQGKALCELVDLMARSGQLQRAEAISAAIADPTWRLFSETVLASHLPTDAGLSKRVGEILASLPARIPHVPDATLRLGLRTALIALGTEFGIAQDVTLIVQACREDVDTLAPSSSRAPALSMLYKCLSANGFQCKARTVLAEIRSLASQEPLGDLLRYEIASDLANNGRFEQTRELVADIEDPTLRMAAHVNLGKALYVAGSTDEGRAVLETTAQKLNDGFQPADREAILTALAPAFLEVGEQQRGLALLEEIKEAAPKARTLLEIASILARCQARKEAYARLQEAQELIVGIDLRTPRTEAIGAMALCWWSRGEAGLAHRLLAEACKLQIGTPATGTSKQAEIAGFLTTAWLRMGREDRARRLIEGLSNQSEIAAARSALVAFLLTAKRLSEAREIVIAEHASLGGSEDWIQRVGQLVGSLTRAGAYEAGLAIVAQIEEAMRVVLPLYRSAATKLGKPPEQFVGEVENSLVELHGQLAVALHSLGQAKYDLHLAQAHQLAQGIEDMPIRVRALVRLAAVLTDTGCLPDCESLFQEAEAVAGSISIFAASAAWEAAAQGYLRAGQVEAACRAAEKIYQHDRQEKMKAKIALTLIHKKELSAAESLLATITDAGRSVAALSALAIALLEANRPMKALGILRPLPQDVFLQVIASWLAQSKGAEDQKDQSDNYKSLDTSLLVRLVRIASWRSVGWENIYNILGAESAEKGTTQSH